MKKSFLLVTLLFTISLLFAQEAEVNEHKENLTGPFSSPQEVTKACLECHEEVGAEIIASRHWNWAEAHGATIPAGKTNLGKKNIINNFCIAVPSNYPRCTSCHIGFGWKDKSFDFTKEENIDCLVCHDQTGTYKKNPKMAGMPDEKVDLLKVAQNVGPTSRQNCGTCHFNGGGGNGVKHGDMDSSLLNPSADFDVHMGGQDFSCAECHTSDEHKIAGKSHSSRYMGTGTNVDCENCHEGEIHKKKKLNAHIKSVACQTCHIPTFAKEIPTKMWWDWSTAGTKAVAQKDENGMPDFMNKKGNFKWGKNVVPEYKWYNKSAGYYLLGDKIDPNKTLVLNPLNTSITDENAKIAPFKVMRGKQIYDAERNVLIVPKLYGKGGFWATLKTDTPVEENWINAATLGMKEVGEEFSGKIGWVETEMNWPINHMVVPAKKALKCSKCHGKKATRMDWKALGYPNGDPKKKKSGGGREKLGLIK